jgi:aldose 1-epimerase
MSSGSSVVLRAGELEATVLPELGMVISSLRHQSAELLAQRGGVDAYAARGSTFAIPLLHPWANRLLGWEYEFAGRPVVLERDWKVLHIDGDTGFAMHGLLAASPYWRGISTASDLVVAELDFGAVPEYMAAFPFAHTLRLKVRVLTGPPSALSVSLTVFNDDTVPVPISFGFHPYLTLPDADRSEWILSLPVAGGSLDGPLGARTFDDPFKSLDSPVGGAPSFSVAGGGRRLTVRFSSGFDVAQVYSPADAQLICFEPMTAPVDALRTGEGLRSVAPGETFTAVFDVLVEPQPPTSPEKE